VGPVAWSVLRPGVGGYIYGGARSADISDVATTPPAGMPRPTPTHLITRSSGVSNQVRTGSGTTRPMSTWMGRPSRHLSITPSTNPFPGRPETSPPTGSRFWPASDETGGDDLVGDAGAPQRELSGLIDRPGELITERRRSGAFELSVRHGGHRDFRLGGRDGGCEPWQMRKRLGPR
jgi:hypothetical protein